MTLLENCDGAGLDPRKPGKDCRIKGKLRSVGSLYQEHQAAGRLIMAVYLGATCCVGCKN